MKSLHNLAQEKNLARVKRREMQDMAETIGQHSQTDMSGMEHMMEQMCQMTEIQTKVFVDTLIDVKTSLAKIKETLSNLKITPQVEIPEVKMPPYPEPTINVSPPNVTVNPTPVKVNYPTITLGKDLQGLMERVTTLIETIKPQKEEIAQRTELKKDKYGQVKEIISTYSSGKVITKKVDNSWVTDDQRRTA